MLENRSDEGLESIAEDEEHAEDEVSEVTGPITDDATTEDETADHTQASDEEGKIAMFKTKSKKHQSRKTSIFIVRA